MGSGFAAALLVGVTSGPAMGQGVAGEATWSGSIGFDLQVLPYIAPQNLPGATIELHGWPPSSLRP